MAGTADGARKARETNLKKNPRFYSEIGSKSWKNPQRSHKTGFALIPNDKHKELSAKGGSKTKEDYKAKVGDRFKVGGVEYEVALVEEFTTAEEIHALLEDQDSDSSGISE